MKKTLLATALAVGFAGAASAQTSVTLYGRIDGGFGYEQYKGTDSSGVETKAKRTGGFNSQQNGSRWGLRGSEDLGGGLKAIFTLESGFDMFRGTSSQGGRLFGRSAWLGLQNDAWGAVKLGRDYNFGAKYIPTVVSPHGDIYGVNSVHNTFTSGAGTVRADNMISYETPVFSGFQFGVGYSFNYDGAQPYSVSGPTPDRDKTLLTTGLRYSSGPLNIAASYDQLNKPDDVAGAKDVKSWILGASYDFEVVSLHLGFGQDRNGAITPHDGGTGFANAGGVVRIGRYTPAGEPAVGQYTPDAKVNNYSVGLGIPVAGAGKFMVNWQSSRLGSGAVKDGILAAGGKKNQDIYTLAYRYDLSKRTNLYVSGAYGKGYAFNDMKVQEVVVGLSHGF